MKKGAEILLSKVCVCACVRVRVRVWKTSILVLLTLKNFATASTADAIMGGTGNIFRYDTAPQ